MTHIGIAMPNYDLSYDLCSLEKFGILWDVVVDLTEWINLGVYSQLCHPSMHFAWSKLRFCKRNKWDFLNYITILFWQTFKHNIKIEYLYMVIEEIHSSIYSIEQVFILCEKRLFDKILIKLTPTLLNKLSCAFAFTMHISNI